MKRFNRLTVLVAVIGLAVILLYSFYAYNVLNTEHHKAYRIEVNRILHRISQGVEPDEIDPAAYTYIRNISFMGKDAPSAETTAFFDGAGVFGQEEYIVKPIYQGQELRGYTRFTYSVPGPGLSSIILADLILLAALAAIAGLMLYIKSQILRPFHRIEELPYELSRGHLSPGMKEHPSRYFGKFIWGLDLLRQTLDAQKQTNLRLEKDRQTLVASLSHELKTPVAAIKLYSSALSEGLYESEDKRRECARRIGQKAEQIEHLITDIITTSVSSLQEIEIRSGEFYISDWLKTVVHNHKERLALLKIELEIGAYEDKLLLGDPDKLLEVMDNIIENAIKYGDRSRIGISFAEEDFRQLIRIENTGTPIMPSELPYIFTSFWRGSNTAGKPGNGLGLFICKQLLQKMGGDIYAEAGSQGMSFVLVLKY